ncbi:unnamed protein product, partial [Coregonus sp. 'balchen']
GSSIRRYRAKRQNRSQASDPGRREGKRSLGIGMETGEGADGPSGPGEPGAGPGTDLAGLGCASFNQDSTSLAVGTKTGYKLFSVTSVDKLDCIYESETPDVYIHLVVVVSLSCPTYERLPLQEGTEICNYSYSNNILSVRLNRQSTVTMIPAHDSPLAALTFNASGTKLASASERGTVIRVFSIPEGQRLFEFRRGMKRYVNISSLSFSPDAQFLCASSNTETVHIFKLEQHGPRPQDEESVSWLRNTGERSTQVKRSSRAVCP